MPDEREDAEKSLEVQGVKPTDHATVEDPTGSDAVASNPGATLEDGGLATPKKAPEQFDAES